MDNLNPGSSTAPISPLPTACSCIPGVLPSSANHLSGKQSNKTMSSLGHHPLGAPQVLPGPPAGVPVPLIQAPKDWIPQNLMSGSRQRRAGRKPPLPSPASPCRQGQHGRPIPHSSHFLDSADAHLTYCVLRGAVLP